MEITMQPPTQQAPRFGRDLNAQEWQGYQQAITQAKDVLDIRRLGLITPIRSLPTETETGIGSLPGARQFFKFLTALGFDSVQVDPEGKTKLGDASPYTGTVFSTNPLYIDLNPLVEDPAWAGILSRNTLDGIVQGNPNPDGAKVAYKYIFQAQDEALKEAYRSFRQKLDAAGTLPADESAAVRDIEARFQAFVRDNHAWLEPDALYEALSAEYGNDYWPAWKGPKEELDKNLFAPVDAAQAQEAEARKAEIKGKHADVIGAYQFAQFIAAEQKKEFKTFASAQGFDVMADRQVGFSDRDVWAYRKVFLPGWSLGCPPDYFSATGQAWDFPVLDPDQLFNPDGSLGEGGKLMQRLFEKIFEENPGGVRIDHIIGLIDPWVYPKGASSTVAGTRLYSSPEHPELGRYAHVTGADLDHAKSPDNEKRVKPEALSDAVVDRYARILDQIVMPAAQAKGVSTDGIICEDLGTLTNPVLAVLKKRGYSGIRVTQFVNPAVANDLYRGRNAEPHHWITTGTHDNQPILMWSKQQLKEGKAGQHADMLGEDLVPDPAGRPDFQTDISQNPLALVRAKFAELFASPARQVQVFFADLFGQEEVYNRPGTGGDGNWSLRVPKDFRQAYFNAVKEGKGLNLPEALLAAMRARNVQNPQLEAELSKYADILRQ